MWKKEISILLLEDNPDDVELLNIALSRSKIKYQIEVIETKKQLKSIEIRNFDLVLSDYNLGSYDGLSAIQLVRKKDKVIPIILISGTVGEELAVEVLHAGANDFVLKSNLKKVPLAIERAMSESQMIREKEHFQKELLEQKLVMDTIFDSFASMVFLKDKEGIYLKVNRAFCEYFQKTENEIKGLKEEQLFPDWISEKAVKNDKYVCLTGKQVIYEVDHVDGLGNRTVLEITKTPILDGNNVNGIVGQCRDITKQKILTENRDKVQTILHQAERFTRSGSFEYDTNLDTISCSPNFMRIMNLDVPGNTISFRKFVMLVKKEDREIFSSEVLNAIESQTEYINDHRFDLNRKDDGIYGHFRLVIKPDYKGNQGTRFYGTVLDITHEQEGHVSLMNRQEEERKEIARDLHDNLGQQLNAASMYVSKIADDMKDHVELQKVRSIIHETIDTLGYIIASISVKHIEEHSLDYSVDKLLSYLPRNIEVDRMTYIDEEILSTFIKTQIFRVIQEVALPL
ncbi:MAG: response regulator, partial [Bacteroidota bacterium]